MELNPKNSVTAHLLTKSTHPPYSAATETHPFLSSAGNGTLSESLLAFWLYQDRIYASHAYPRFIGSLISHIPFDRVPSGSRLEPDHSQRILKILVFSLENIVREIGFFEDTAREWNLNLEGWKQRKGTRDYTAEMAKIASSGRIEEGLLFLWAMEKVYLDAWSSVYRNLTSISCNPASDDYRKMSPVMSFATNWSTPDFKCFVDDLALLVDELYKDRNPGDWSHAEGIWQRVIELEAEFWPADAEVAEVLVGYGS